MKSTLQTTTRKNNFQKEQAQGYKNEQAKQRGRDQPEVRTGAPENAARKGQKGEMTGDQSDERKMTGQGRERRC